MRNNIELYDKIEKFIPNHKMGFKILNDDQLKNIFPTYQMMLDKIKYHREKLNEHERIEGLDSQYNLMYDNVYSIMGKRGSGKTSAIFTLKKKIEMTHPSDIVLPIIMPEMIPEDVTILGWILVMLEDVVKKLDEKMEKNWSTQNSNNHFGDCRYSSDGKLRKTYDNVKELYFSRQFNNQNTESFAMAVGNVEIQTLNSFLFAKELAKFWDALVDAIVYTEKNEKNPLIYLMFDDVDLTPDKVMELLSTIIKYLSHPNLVIILTADEELFYEVIEHDFESRLYGDSKGATLLLLNDKRIEEVSQAEICNGRGGKIKETSKLYMDKVMPPSSRYYLEVFDNCRKKRAFVETVDTVNQEKKNKNLEAFLRDEINEYLKVRKSVEVKDEYDNFLYYRGEKERFLQAYLLFWGNTSRQLANECFIMLDLFNNLTACFEKVKREDKKVQYVNDVHKQIQEFIRNTINVNVKIRDVVTNINHFVEEVCPQSKNQWKIYINYRALDSFYREKRETAESEEEEQKIISVTVSLYMLLFFVENVLLIGDSMKDAWSINRERNRVHGIKYLVNMLDGLLTEERSLVRNSREEVTIQRLLNDYEEILFHPEQMKNFSIFERADVKDYLFPLYTQKTDEKVGAEELYKWHVDNPRWFRTITAMIYLNSIGIYASDENGWGVLKWGENVKIYDTYLRQMMRREKEDMRVSLSPTYRYGEEKTKGYNKLLNEEIQNEEIQNEEIQNEEIQRTVINMFDSVIEDIMWSENVILSLEELREEFIRRLQVDGYSYYIDEFWDEESEEPFGECCLIYAVFKKLKMNELTMQLTKEVVRNSIQQLRSELIQNYRRFNFYYVEDDNKVLQSLDELKENYISAEYEGYVEQAIYELNNGRWMAVPTVNKLFECLEKEVKEESVYWKGYVFEQKQEFIRGCKKILQKNLHVNIGSGGKNSKQRGIDIIILHEALLQLQRIYLNLLLEEKMDTFGQKEIVSESFYQKYLSVMRDILMLRKPVGRKKRSWDDIYLRRYMQEIVEEAVNEFLEKQFSVQKIENEVEYNE